MKSTDLPSPSLKGLFKPFSHIFFILHLIWDFVESDFVTFAVPNTAFGVIGAMASSVLVGEAPFPAQPTLQILQRLPNVVAFNVANLLVFDLANQRSPDSGKITMDQTRRCMLIVIPATLALNYALGPWRQGLFIMVLTWLYNDLRGGDEVFLRELIIAVAYGMFNSGSLIVAVGPGNSLSPLGLVWTVVVSGIILTTMQIQDLKDQDGDRTRGRKTIAVYLGEWVSRTSIAFFICFWSCS
ncbi:hypothetical protein VPNG_08073 [Cytospora leucostoma]|uniref:Uncharacterized protein n=1 Tax=Cytospora leucostoma TaxID=1230097 RepID=A0A423WS74_9PEZI|nr:hypothetical protein VPNG_08073 [Cytospora leucostoma]